MKNRSMITLGMIATTIALTFCGCNKKNAETQEENTVTTTPAVEQDDSTATATPEVEPERVEPSLTEEAKKLTQFADVKQGDIVAEITVKDFGTLKLKLFPKQAPKAVENFVTHAKEGYYDGLTFHRIFDDFMIQGGDPKGDGTGGESIWGEKFEDEFSDDLYPYRGALCMANSGSNTNGSQFFIVQGDEVEVNHLQDLVTERYGLSLIDYVKQAYDVDLTQKELDGYLIYGGTPWLTKHHTVFGQLFEGFDVLDTIAATPLADDKGKPKTPVVIEKINIIEQ